MSHRYLFLLCCFFTLPFLAASPVAVCESYVNVAVPYAGCTADIQVQDIDRGSYDRSCDVVAKWVTGGLNLAPGLHTVTLNVWACGVTNQCWSTVLVEDKTNPVVTCHNQTIYLVAPDQPFTLNVDNMATFTDNCEVTEELSFTVNDGSRFGSDPFTARGTDAAGNRAECTGTVTTVDAEPQNYCSNNRNDYYEHIANLTLTTSSGTVHHSSGSNGGYNWHYPTTGNVLYHGFNYTLNYTPGFRFSTTYHEYWRVYLDANADGDFTDSGELLHQWHGYGGNSFTFRVPGNTWGWSRIRVVMGYGSYPGPCGSGYGETEDISVYLRRYFSFPMPGFQAINEAQDSREAADHDMALPITEDRPVEAVLAGEASRRNIPEPLPGSHPSATSLRLYPNPVRAGEQLTITGQPVGNQMQLFNLTGKILQTYAGPASRLTIPDHLPAGIYLLRGDGWSRRVVVR